MKQIIPTPKIIDDLLVENWQLRWQVFEIFHQVRISIRNHVQNSPEHQEFLRLGKKLAAHLNEPSDRNLHLIMTATYFLGGNQFLFLLFPHLGIDDSDDFYPALSKLKKALTNEEPDLSFFDYFHALFSSNKAIERTTAIAAAFAIRVFSAEKTLQLFIDIPHPESRSAAFDLFQEIYPEPYFNDYLFADGLELLTKQPELLRFITPPLTADQAQGCTIAANFLLADSPDNRTAAIRAIGRLKLDQCLPLLDEFQGDNLETATAHARLNNEYGCRELLTAAKSWHRKKRLAALPGLAFCNSFEALEVLKKRVAKGDLNERHIAFTALGRNKHPEALPFLIATLKQKHQNEEYRLLLSLLARHPNSTPNPETANLLARWYDNCDLYPELLEALAAFGYGNKWGKIVNAFTPPLLLPHHQKIALFMTRFADRPAIKKNLLALLTDIDWAFSYRLLILLQPHLNGKDLKTLLNLLQEHEKAHDLTIRERLLKGDDIPRFTDALCEFLNLNLVQADEILSRFIAELMEGDLPKNAELTARFQQQPADLKKLILEAGEFSSTLPEPELPLLHILRLLSEITLDGSNCLAAIVNRTRKYGGFFQQTISTLISIIIDHDHDLQNTQALPDLQAIINFLRQRPHYDELRQKILRRIAEITRNAKDLQIYLGATHDRELRIIKVRRNTVDK